MRKYQKPELYQLYIVAERGYGDSVGLPSFGTEQDELTSYGKGAQSSPFPLAGRAKDHFFRF